MRRWSPDRGQTEPLAAIVAVFAVCVGLAAYTGVLADATPASDRDLAPTTLSRVEDAASTNGVVEPAALARATAVGPDGHRVNATLTLLASREADPAGTGAVTDWHAGPPAPLRADAATAAVSVRVAPGEIRPARLRVEVWR